MAGDACIAGDAYSVDAPDLTPVYGSSCDSIFPYPDFSKNALRTSVASVNLFSDDRSDNAWLTYSATPLVSKYLINCIWSNMPRQMTLQHMPSGVPIVLTT